MGNVMMKDQRPKFVSDYEAIYGEDDAAHRGKPHGWIQWKGTGVCIDLHCECGAHGHVDTDFFYFYKCFSCGRVYAVGQNVALIPLTPEQQAHAETLSCGVKIDEERKDEKEFQELINTP